MTLVDFTTALLRRFGPTDFDNPSEAQKCLRQTTILDVYQQEFERFSQLIEPLSDCYLIGCFVAGLKDDIRIDIKLKNPRTFPEVIGSRF